MQKSLFALAVLFFGSFGSAQAATIIEPALDSDINVGSAEYLPAIPLASISGTYSLVLPYGIWNGNGANESVNITVDFNGQYLGTLNSTLGYYTTPQSATFDVTRLVSTENQVVVLGTDVSGDSSDVEQYAVGAGANVITAPLATPLPGSMTLFLSGLGIMGFFAFRKKQDA